MHRPAMVRTSAWLSAIAILVVGATSMVANAASAMATPPKTWSVSAQYPSGGNPTSLTSVSCASARDCVAVGRYGSQLGVAIYTTDGGATWTISKSGVLTSQQSYANGFFGVSCVPYKTSAWCDAVASVGTMAYVVYSSDAGMDWNEGSLLDASALVSISCVPQDSSAPWCVVVGYGAYYSHDGGKTWTLSPSVSTSGTPALSSVSCANNKDCVAVGTSSYYTVNGGSTWTEINPNPVLAPVGYVSCAQAHHRSQCTAVFDNTSCHSNDGGPSWTCESGFDLGPSGRFDPLSCVTGSTCTAGGETSGGAEVLDTTDGGSDWAISAAGTAVFSKASSLGGDRVSSDPVSCVAELCSAVGKGSDGNPLIFIGPRPL